MLSVILNMGWAAENANLPATCFATLRNTYVRVSTNRKNWQLMEADLAVRAVFNDTYNQHLRATPRPKSGHEQTKAKVAICCTMS